MLSACRSGVLRSVLNGKGAINVLAAVPNRDKSDKPWIPRGPTMKERIETWDYVNSVYFGPDRDMKNFPHPTQPDFPEPARMGIIPNTWFEFFYPKTGVTGPYVFGGGLFLFMMSKEYMVYDHYFTEVAPFIAMCWYLCRHPKVGGFLKETLYGIMDNRIELEYERPLRKSREFAETNLNKASRQVEETEAEKHMHQVKKEGIELQLEAAYRDRLQTAFQEVKKRLDYEVDKENVKRRFEQQHMVNWIVDNVRKSITPQQEKDSIRSCIDTLKTLATKQPAIM